MTNASLMISVAIAAVSMTMPVWAADHRVEMLNKDSEGRAMQFEPAFLQIAPGDTVTFVPTSKGHNSESISGLLPEGAQSWKGKFNEEITVTFDQEGSYAYKCAPHVGMGMVGLIKVGEDAAPLAEAEVAKLPTKAEARMSELIAQGQ